MTARSNPRESGMCWPPWKIQIGCPRAAAHCRHTHDVVRSVFSPPPHFCELHFVFFTFLLSDSLYNWRLWPCIIWSRCSSCSALNKRFPKYKRGGIKTPLGAERMRPGDVNASRLSESIEELVGSSWANLLAEAEERRDSTLWLWWYGEIFIWSIRVHFSRGQQKVFLKLLKLMKGNISHSFSFSE